MERQIVVLGTYHALQGAQNRGVNQNQNIDDPSYGVLIEHLIEEHSLKCIFEEASECGQTTAKELANKHGLEYLDVDPGEDHRAQHGIQPLSGAVYDIYKPSDPDSPSPGDIVEEYLEAQSGREEFWMKGINGQVFDNGLMICGFIHTLSVAFRLKCAGFRVIVLVYQPSLKLANGWIARQKTSKSPGTI